MNVVPTKIQAIIDAHLELERVEREDKERKEQAERQILMERGKQRVQAWINEQLEDVYAYMHPYFSGLNVDETDLDGIWKHWGKEDRDGEPSYDSVFRVPGLAPIIYYASKAVATWGSATALREYEWEWGRMPVWGTSWSCVTRRETLEAVLSVALEQQEIYAAYESEALKIREEIRQDDERKAKLQADRDYDNAIAHQAEQIEIDELCGLVRNDPIARQALRLYQSIASRTNYSEDW